MADKCLVCLKKIEERSDDGIRLVVHAECSKDMSVEEMAEVGKITTAEEELINSYVMGLFEKHDPRHVVSLAICSHIIGSIIRSSGGLITKEVCLTLIDAGVQLGDDSK